MCARLRMRQHPKASSSLCSLQRSVVFITAHALFHLFLPILCFYSIIFTFAILLFIRDHRVHIFQCQCCANYADLEFPVLLMLVRPTP